MGNLGVYLGFPLLHNRVNRSTFDFITEKFRQKLSGWEAKKLSMAGRVTLARSILLSIPNYFMYTVKIPISVCMEIERIACKFIWGSTNEDRKVALLSWDNCCKPLDRGGLGIRKLREQNKIFLMKLGYRMLSNTESLWVQVLRKKYNVQEIIPISIRRSNGSFIWQSLVKIWPEVTTHVFWSIGDGRLVNFWDDVWLRHVGPLRQFGAHLDFHTSSLRVTDVVTSTGTWDWDSIVGLIPGHIMHHIASFMPPNFDMGPDHLLWTWNDKNGFSTSASYKNLFGHVSQEHAH